MFKLKKYIRFIMVVLSIILIVCCTCVIANAKTLSIAVGSATVVDGESGTISIELDNFTGFTGGYNFEIKFPDFIEIENVSLDGKKLTELTKTGGDYKVSTQNMLTIIGTCNYGDDTILTDDSTILVGFAVKEGSAEGGFEVQVTDNTNIVSAKDDMRFIKLNKISGMINVLSNDYVIADINQDGVADINDIVVLRKFILGVDYGSKFDIAVADHNMDGHIDIMDLVGVNEHVENLVIYLSSCGNDVNSGNKQDAPVATLNTALEKVSVGGKIQIIDTYTVSNSFVWEKHNKDVEITGGIFDASAVSTLNISDNITFKAITLNVKNNANIYANGYTVEICEDVTVNGKSCLYGGGTSSVESTKLKIYSGSYSSIYGGGDNADVEGSTNVVIGGNVNNSLDVSNHSLSNNIYAGCNGATVFGNTYLTIKDDARFNYIFGGGGIDGPVKGKINVNIYDGEFMGAFGGGKNGISHSDIEFNFYGGTIEQIFGGNEGNVVYGNTYVNIYGGTIVRRIYGGCYNECSWTYDFETRHHVGGKTTVFLTSNATINCNYSTPDNGIFGCTRYSEYFNDEDSYIIFEDEKAKTKFESKLGQQDKSLTSSWCGAAKTVKVQEQ